ncbi:hypothetical protein ELH91_07935 [Rhizobium leguminosarum]|uniref:hypothetical protein n=1 Tax=Rhizobium leguminosarum TaxID=384 RepID=UPI001030275F|nr:hypothetical protein [Rhizobium leguminosarum]TAY16708.1 hypothetical protein ELH91_07935 [Rhizobium leguminosarum]
MPADREETPNKRKRAETCLTACLCTSDDNNQRTGLQSFRHPMDLYHAKCECTNPKSPSRVSEHCWGDTLLGKLTSQPYINEMKKGVEENVPPVSKISHLLQEHFVSVPDITALAVRQFVGMAVRAILAEEGYEVEERGVRISGDPVFRSGSTYRLVKTDEEEEEDLLVRFGRYAHGR